jgi:NAD(P)H-nitrite reductase large subunit
VASFHREKGRLTAALESGKKLETDLVILSIGVRPDSRLDREAGLEPGERGGIVGHPHLQTSDPDIYILGDAVVLENPIIHKPMLTYLAGPANKQGRILADNLAGGNRKAYGGAIGTASAKRAAFTT